MGGCNGTMRRSAGIGCRVNGVGRPPGADAGRWAARAVVGVLLAAAGAAAAPAQDAAAPPRGAAAQEPRAGEGLTLEEIRSSWVVAPDFKFTRIDGGDAALVGAYGGKIIDRRLLVGGGLYWLRGASHVDMAYGGGLAEWFGNPGGLVDFSLRGFIGFGAATLSDPFAFDGPCDDFGDFDPGRLFDMGAFDVDLSGPRRGRGGDRGRPPTWWSPCWPDGMESFGAGAPRAHFGAGRDGEWPDDSFDPFEHGDPFGFRQNFFLAEPQASIHLNLTPWLRVGGGAGYRLIGSGGEFTDRLRGLTANIGLQIGRR